MSNRVRPQTVTIADAQTVSGEAYTGGEPVVAIVTPSTWTTASIGLQASANGADFFVVQSGGGDFAEAAVAASRYVPVDPFLTAGAVKVKVVAGAAQAGGDTITVVTRGVA